MAYINKETLLDLALQMGAVPSEADIDELKADDLQTLIEKKARGNNPVAANLERITIDRYSAQQRWVLVPRVRTRVASSSAPHHESSDHRVRR